MPDEMTVVLTGQTGILLHADSIDWADLMEEWKNDPANKKKSVAGDDRTPPWRWMGCLTYTDPQNGVVAIMAEYIMKCLMGGATQVTTGKGKQSFKSDSQSSILCKEFAYPLLVNGKPIQMEAINKLKELKTFKEHIAAVSKLGFALFYRRAKVGDSKHIRVRPLFDNWSVTVTLQIFDDRITKTVLGQFFEIAGRTKGLGDWRPGAPKSPGSFGMFKAKVL